MGLYLFTVVTLAGMAETAYISKYFGYLVGLTVLLKIFTKGFVVTNELLLFGGWILWSLTGALVVVSHFIFWTWIFTFLQIFILFALLLRVADNYKNILVLTVFFFLGFLAFAGITFLSGSYSLSIETGERIEGLTENSNSFAMMIHNMLILQLLFYELTKKKWLKISLLALLPLLAKLILASGSKKGFIFFVFILMVWFFLFHGRDALKKPFYFSLLIFAGALFIGWLISSLSGSMLGERLDMMQQTLEGGAGSEGDRVRMELVGDAIKCFFNHPVIGVGLFNFRFYSSSGLYAHNGYLELLTNGGLIGFILMFGVYWNLFKKSLKGFKSQLLVISKVSKIVLVFFSYVALISLVSPMYMGKHHWVMLGLITAFYEVSRKKRLLN
ncbi:O-antigen ligase family protein [Sedimentisphaera salicampi]|uniref:O-antigen ligase family protein n=1 Tax=Sedimentisphaera salicampi TaxID=1941349 RepID=UPI00137B81BB|nr:O-antigen ligase family protein [Sedimentisphaera salicampi]